MYRDVIQLAQLWYSVHLTCDQHHEAGKLSDTATPSQYHDWAVGQTSHINSPAWGMLAGGLSTIYLCDAAGLNRALQWQTLYHEVGHALAIRSSSDGSEAMANIVGEQLATLLRWHVTYATVRSMLDTLTGAR